MGIYDISNWNSSGWVNFNELIRFVEEEPDQLLGWLSMFIIEKYSVIQLFYYVYMHLVTMITFKNKLSLENIYFLFI